MCRLMVLFFTVLLPLQFAWAAASAYCQHETNGIGATHFGHHAHVHQGEAAKSVAGNVGSDGDCASCHAAGASLLHAALHTAGVVALPAAVPRVPALPFTSALARAPDRPQWPRLV